MATKETTTVKKGKFALVNLSSKSKWSGYYGKVKSLANGWATLVLPYVEGKPAVKVTSPYGDKTTGIVVRVRASQLQPYVG